MKVKTFLELNTELKRLNQEIDRLIKEISGKREVLSTTLKEIPVGHPNRKLHNFIKRELPKDIENLGKRRAESEEVFNALIGSMNK